MSNGTVAVKVGGKIGDKKKRGTPLSLLNPDLSSPRLAVPSTLAAGSVEITVGIS